MRALLILALLAAPCAAQNILPGGDFEKGKDNCPAGWDRPDGLTSFWVKDPVRKGHCMRFDTDVYKTEYVQRREEMKLPEPPPARPKTPTRGAKYDTAAGVQGVPFFSEPVPIDPKVPYRIRVDFMPGAVGLPKATLVPKIFIKGYISLECEVWDEQAQKAVVRAIERVAFKEYKNLEDGEPGKWKTYTFYSWPGRRNPRIHSATVMLFPYWPPGEYFFDNVRLEPLDVATWEKENTQLRELEAREKERERKIVPGRGAGNTPSKRQKGEERGDGKD